MTSKSSQRIAILAAVVMSLVMTGCLNRDLAPAEPHTQSGVLEEIQQTGTTRVDMLFVVDNSNSMSEEQVVLTDQIRTMAEELINPSDPSAPSVQDLHIGIVTTDMGTHGYTIQTCSNPSNGDNGVLQNIGRQDGCAPSYSAPDCDRAECPWLIHSAAFPDDGSDPANSPIWEDFGCIASLGTGGCGFEQQLESSYMALVVNTEAGRPNEGFLRDDSLLAIVYVTDEDDCSTNNAEMFNPSRDDYGPLNVRCALSEHELYPISRYTDAFIALRGGDADSVVVAAITGVPVDGSWNPGDPIERLRELRQVNPSNSNELLKSCDTAMGAAYPPVRIAELVYSFGNNGILESICRADWTAALQAITRKIQDKLPGVCVERALASTGSETCRVIETLINDGECPHAADTGGSDRTFGWHLDLGLVETDGVMHRRCEILPADYDGDGIPDGADSCLPDSFDESGILQGWFYDNTCSDCDYGQVRFTHTDVTSDRSSVRFECLTALCPAARECGSASRPPEEGCRSTSCDCGAGEVCVQHVSEDICGWTFARDADGNQIDENADGRPDTRPCGCSVCSPTLGATCHYDSDTPAAVLDRPLVGAGGCCAEGFHCENGTCIGNRTNTDCI